VCLVVQVNYPNWECGQQGQALLSRLQSFQEKEMEADPYSGTGLGPGPLMLGTHLGAKASMLGMPVCLGGSYNQSVFSGQHSSLYAAGGVPFTAFNKGAVPYACTGLAYEMETSFYWLERYAERQAAAQAYRPPSAPLAPAAHEHYPAITPPLPCVGDVV
jgi:hypothetical protein